MANRYLAFGYKIADGKLCVEETEAELVKAAFSLYAAGKSYSQIAEGFTLSGIRYNIDSDKWNKNMVKRIIENDKYIGRNGYPQIIEEKLYNKANKTRLSKVVNKPPEKAELDNFMRTHSECPICSSPIKRQNQCYGENRSVAYKCTNSVCPAKSVKENRLVNLITELLNKIADDLSLADEPVITAIPDDELTDDMANDIYIKMLTEYDKDEMLADIYELAKIKFRNSIKTDMSAVTERIKKELCKYGIITEPHLPLMQKIISKFYVGGQDELSILLTNGKLITRSVN